MRVVLRPGKQSAGVRVAVILRTMVLDTVGIKVALKEEATMLSTTKSEQCGHW